MVAADIWRRHLFTAFFFHTLTHQVQGERATFLEVRVHLNWTKFLRCSGLVTKHTTLTRFRSK